jgi:hypothetical protein
MLWDDDLFIFNFFPLKIRLGPSIFDLTGGHSAFRFQNACFYFKVEDEEKINIKHDGHCRGWPGNRTLGVWAFTLFINPPLTFLTGRRDYCIQNLACDQGISIHHYMPQQPYPRYFVFYHSKYSTERDKKFDNNCRWEFHLKKKKIIHQQSLLTWTNSEIDRVRWSTNRIIEA